MIHVDDLASWLPLNRLKRTESQSAIRRNPLIQFARKLPLKALSRPNRILRHSQSVKLISDLGLLQGRLLWLVRQAASSAPACESKRNSVLFKQCLIQKVVARRPLKLLTKTITPDGFGGYRLNEF
jgi:hypothetical protein